MKNQIKKLKKIIYKLKLNLEDLEKILVALTNFKKEANNAKDQSKV